MTDADSALFLLLLRDVRISKKETRSRRFAIHDRLKRCVLRSVIRGLVSLRLIDAKQIAIPSIYRAINLENLEILTCIVNTHVGLHVIIYFLINEFLIR